MYGIIGFIILLFIFLSLLPYLGIVISFVLGAIIICAILFWFLAYLEQIILAVLLWLVVGFVLSCFPPSALASSGLNSNQFAVVITAFLFFGLLALYRRNKKNTEGKERIKRAANNVSL
jgi:hypothetical protein